ncbi:hypothetical protein FBU30_010588 [Linnemannia zychae]|nr:hypothetical protein FBU30_010588 [Linnemannia zychae]
MNKRRQSRSPTGNRRQLQKRQFAMSAIDEPLTITSDTYQSIPELQQPQSSDKDFPQVRQTQSMDKFSLEQQQVPLEIESEQKLPQSHPKSIPSRQETQLIDTVKIQPENTPSKSTPQLQSTQSIARTTRLLQRTQSPSSQDATIPRVNNDSIVKAVICGENSSIVASTHVGHTSNPDNSDYEEYDATLEVNSATDSESDDCEENEESVRSHEEVDSVSKESVSKAQEAGQYETLLKILVFTPIVEILISSSSTQNDLQDQHQAALDEISAKEGNIIEELQSDTSHLSSSTRRAYKVIMIEYKNFCDKYYSERKFERYELDGPKAVVFLKDVVFIKRVHKHIGSRAREKKIYMLRGDVERNGIPIDGMVGEFDLESCRHGGGVKDRKRNLKRSWQ